MSESAGSGGHVHRYHATCHWEGDTTVGYKNYDRTHTSSAPPAPTELTVSADSSFLGDPQKLNPEQLVVVAASSCQLLSFLAIAARARVQVLEYEDHAEAQMPEEDRPMRLTQITLRPRIVIGPGVKEERVLRFTEMAHEQCYIANSLSTDVVVEPKIEIREREAAD
jgi:organic hydroperoxide reductase OsmC/OhrA